MELQEQTEILLELCRTVHARGLVSGSGGNISMRLSANRLLITPSGRSLGALAPEDIIVLHADGSWEGKGKPSKEWRMHQLSYARTEVQAALHVHSVHAVALSCLAPADSQCAMPVFTPGYGLRAGQLPVLPYMLPGSAALAEAVGKVLVDRNSVLLANHGLMAVGKSAEEALNIVEEIEENAHIFFILGGSGKGRPLNEKQIAELVGYR